VNFCFTATIPEFTKQPKWTAPIAVLKPVGKCQRSTATLALTVVAVNRTIELAIGTAIVAVVVATLVAIVAVWTLAECWRWLMPAKRHSRPRKRRLP
jgi:hypothetical protein